MQIKKIDKSFLNDIYEISQKEFLNESYSIGQLKDCLNNKDNIYFCIFLNNDKTNYIIALETVDDINILSIATKKEYKNQGLATSLIKNLMNYATSNNKSVSLEVKSKNAVAYNLYLKLGFKVVSKRLNYYKDKDTALIMFYNLQQYYQ